MKLLLLILAVSFLLVSSSAFRLAGPSRSERARWIRRYQDEDPEPTPTGDFLIGSDQQRVELMLDLTTTDTWVVDVNCGEDLCLNGNVGFRPSTTNTLKNLSAPFQGSFQTWSGAREKVFGYQVQDSFTHSASPPSNITWTQKFSVVERSDNNIRLNGWDPAGVLGVAPGVLINSLLPSSMNPRVLTLWMHEVEDDQHLGDQIYEGFKVGSMEFEWYNNCDNTTYVNTSTIGNTWKFTVEGLSIGDYTAANVNDIAEINAQSMFTHVPTQIWNDIVKMTGAHPGDRGSFLEVDCSVHYPDWRFTINGQDVWASENVYISRDDIIHESQKCHLMLAPMDATGFAPKWKLGYLWFYEKCIHLFAGQQLIGFSGQTWW